MTDAPRKPVRIDLVREPPVPEPARRWPAEIAALLAPADPDAESAARSGAGAQWAPYRVRGGPGTGKTSLLVDIVTSRLAAGADPESILVLTASRRSAAAMRARISAGMLGGADRGRPPEAGGRSAPLSAREPLVRTIHSYAFAVLRLRAVAHDDPPPRLITGSEQDAVLRELLAGDIDDGARYWPPHLRPALGTNGFAQALRDLMMRAAERGVGPEQLIALGRKHRKPEWEAAGKAWRVYEQSTLLRGAVGRQAPQATAPAVDAAELIGSALDALAADPDLLAAQRGRLRCLLVDDAQHLDPQAAELIRRVGVGADIAVITGDADQSIYGFRGASAAFLNDLDTGDATRDLFLGTNFRSGPTLNRVGQSIAARLPGARRNRVADAAGPEPIGESGVGVKVLSSTAKEATAVADLLRRAHLYHNVPWSEMAVIVRSVPRAMIPLRRALRSAGVPLTTPAAELPIARQPLVAALLLALRAVSGPLDADQVTDLLTGPIGRADPAAMRRLRRAIRRVESARAEAGQEPRDSTAVLIELLAAAEADAGYLAELTDFERTPIQTVRRVIDAARRAEEQRRGIEDIVWSTWQATQLERRLAGSALRGGAAGDQADRDLDAVLAMFDAAANFADSLPAARLDGFVSYLDELQIPGESATAAARTDAVTVLSAHAATGREWDVVAVPGVQDGLWPSLRSRGSILGTTQLVDLLDGIDEQALGTVSRSALALAEERRLLLVACSRARRQLLVTAVDDGGGEDAPSRFVGELAGIVASLGDGRDPDTDGDDPPIESEIELDPGVRRTLSLPSLIAELRSQVVSIEPGAMPTPRQEAAARLLARLADAEVPGAHPVDWYGLAGPSTSQPLWSGSGPVTLSPSAVDVLSTCSLRWMLERFGGRDGDSQPAVTGTLVHTLVQAVAGNIPPDEVAAALRRVWDHIDVGAQWFSDSELARTDAMLTNFRDWLRLSRDSLTETGVEVDVEAVVPAGPVDIVAAGEDGQDPDVQTVDAPPIRLRGRIDRLERDSAGRPVVIDVKTAKTTISVEQATTHAQLATYQLALALDGVPGVSGPPGGGQLVYVNNANQKTGAAVRQQSPLDAEQLATQTAQVRAAGIASIGPGFVAAVNPGCGHCGLQSSCPAQLAGRTVTDD
ncbi:ATP-dependent helicase [Jongsikchunia kroppenstedtii]|uniref:ATP-dependent helicase n=1 Tax=Jongsikchunia kroppenstedtii TaxID=1121721 RepID=UPI00035EFFAA|nr:ATP-dependent DNA helicase [Jongsikchunia kroppenstedtii]